MIFVGVGLLLLLAAAVTASDTEGITEEYSVYIGARVVDTSDYNKKVGEYESIEEDVWPQFGLTYRSYTPNSVFYVDGRYNDANDIFGFLSIRVGDQFTGKVRYQSMVRHTGQDLLENIEAREWLPVTSSPGGKMLTHEIIDTGADYSYERKEIMSQFSVLLSRRNNVKLIAAHRTIMKDGHEQSIANNHCFSCHLTSQEAKVQDRTHNIEAGLEADVKNLDVGYLFGYRIYESGAPMPYAYYDDARHPVNGGAGAEFASRLNYEDATLPYDGKPRTEKTSHKVKVKGDAGKGRFATSFNYTKALNDMNNLAAKSWAGAFNYAVPISPKTRLVAKASATGIDVDDPFVDVNTHRPASPTPADFDFTRYSTLDRSTIDISAEVMHRLNPKVTLSFLAGYESVDRKDYPIVDDGTKSGTFTGQAKLRYRKGLKYATTFKYRFEKTSDPFVSGRGLFEAEGHGFLDPIHIGSPGGTPSYGYFYYQREDLRYQEITTVPTDYHEVELKTTYRPTTKASINLKLAAIMDKNGDLDSLDVEHSKLNGDVSFTLTPNLKWTLSGGVGHQMEKSRGPVTVALFDG
jgi:hypothetical protein